MDDIPWIVEIEKRSFPTPWSAYAFSCELSDNEFAHYLVATPEGDPAKVVGYGGMWIIIDEAHITNVAVAPDYRGKSLGTFLMNGLFAVARKKGVLQMTLEVRITNSTARSLYEKLGFEAAGIRPGYYVDTQEDAFIMWKKL